ncbi:hypothetical protein ACOMHN_008321 [Nucella lapillus]
MEEKAFATISKDSVKLIAESIGISGLSDDVAALLGEDVNYRLREIVMKSTAFMKGAKRRRLCPEDFNQALRDVNAQGNKCSVIHFPASLWTEFSNRKLNLPANQRGELHFVEESDVNFNNTVCNSYVPKYLGETSIKAQWMALEGVNRFSSSSHNAAHLQHTSKNIKKESSAEIVAYYKHITRALVGSRPCLVKWALANLSVCKRVQLVLPYFVNFIANAVKVVNHDVRRLIVLMRAVAALVKNRTVFLGMQPYLRLLVQAVETCMLEPQTSVNQQQGDHWTLRRMAAEVLAEIVRKWSTSVNRLRPTVVNKLTETLQDLGRPLSSHFGAVVGLMAMGPAEVEAALVPHLPQLLPHLQAATSGHPPVGPHTQTDAITVLEAVLLAVEKLLKNYMSSEDLRNDSAAAAATPKPNTGEAATPLHNSGKEILALYQQLSESLGDVLSLRLPVLELDRVFPAHPSTHIVNLGDSDSKRSGEELLADLMQQVCQEQEEERQRLVLQEQRLAKEQQQSQESLLQQRTTTTALPMSLFQQQTTTTPMSLLQQQTTPMSLLQRQTTIPMSLLQQQTTTTTPMSQLQQQTTTTPMSLLQRQSTPISLLQQQTTTPMSLLQQQSTTPISLLQQQTTTPPINLLQQQTTPMSLLQQQSTTPISLLQQQTTTPPINLLQQQTTPMSLLQRQSTPINLLQQQTTTPMSLLQQQSTTPISLLQQQTTTPMSLLQQQSTTPISLLQQQTTTPMSLLQQQTTTPMSLLQQQSTTPISLLQQQSTTPINLLQQQTTPISLLQQQTTPISLLQQQTTTPMSLLQQQSTTPINLLQQQTTTPISLLQQQTATSMNPLQQHTTAHNEENELRELIDAAAAAAASSEAMNAVEDVEQAFSNELAVSSTISDPSKGTLKLKIKRHPPGQGSPSQSRLMLHLNKSWTESGSPQHGSKEHRQKRKRKQTGRNPWDQDFSDLPDLSNLEDPLGQSMLDQTSQAYSPGGESSSSESNAYKKGKLMLKLKVPSRDSPSD